MSATNQTAVYGLPIFLGTDVPSWLTDWNGAMGDIDTAIAAAKAAADAAAQAAYAAEKKAEADKKAADEAKALATIPSKEEIYAKMLGCVNSPATGIVGSINAVMASLTRAVAAVRDQKSA